MARVLLALLFFLAALPVDATEVEVRSGEHGDFTRLVLRIPVRTEWNLKNAVRSSQLTVALPDLKFEYDTVFERVPRKRLEELRQSEIGAPLEMLFACDCEARAFVQSGTLLVIDIRDRPADSPRLRLPLVRDQVLDVRAEGAVSAPQDHAVEDRVAEIALTEDTELLIADARRHQAFLDIPVPLAGERAVENRLYSRILRGVDQEVLALRFRDEPGTERGSTEAQAALTETLTEGLGLPNLRVTTVVDRDLHAAREGHTSLPAVQQCIEDEQLAVGEWADNRPFSTQHADLRDGLFGEFDKVDARAALALARFYLHFGFGDEASVTLELLKPSYSEHKLLAALAAAVEGRQEPEGNPLAGLQGCDNAVAMWSVLSEKSASEATDTNAVLRSYGRLPLHLRAYLGPVLGEYLANAGFADAAHQLVRAAERINEGDQAAIAVVEAKIAGLNNKPDIREQKLKAVIEDASAPTHAPLALVDLIEKRWSEGGDITPQELLLAASYLHEFRRSEIGPRVQTAYVIALALSAQFDEAIGALAEPGQDRRSEIWQETVDRIVKRIMSHASDITFLRHVAMLDSDLFIAVKADTATLVAQRLIELGFFEDALRYADRPQDRKSRGARAEIIARATLGMGRPHRALLELESTSGAEAERLRAEAMSEAGALEQAAEALLRAGDLDAASRYIWLAGADAPIAGGEETRFGGIHLMGQALLEERKPSAATPLAAARELVDDSTRIRDQIGILLDRLQ
ncbi:hypothetical protein KBY25_01730 [Ruegeria pomeroyi]|nr:hypothetical protein [Ruegeria pomeroyi]